MCFRLPRRNLSLGNSVDSAREDYISKLKAENVPDAPKDEITTVSGVIEKINSAVVDGNTIFFVKLQNNQTIYSLPITLSDELVFADKGQTVELELNGSKVKSVKFN